MYQFFVEDWQVADSSVTIGGSDVNHIRNVLRMKAGEKVRISTSSGKNYFCRLSEIGEAMVQADILEELSEGTELPNKIYLFQGLPKGDKMELIIQKMVELGVYEIVPVAMKRCVVKLDAKKAAAKTARWQGIAQAAAKQSRRAVVPRVQEVLGFQEALAYAEHMDVRLVPYEMEESLEGATGMAGTRQIINQIAPGQSIAVFIGPEGGFEADEIQAALDCGMKPVTLGRRILRTETAGMTVMAWMMYRLER